MFGDRRTTLWSVALALGAIALTSGIYQLLPRQISPGDRRAASRAAAPATHEAPRLASAMERMEGFFPNVVLQTHDNKTMRFYDDLVKGKAVIISFMYTSCKLVCPRTTTSLMAVQRALGDRVGRGLFLYAITLDPAHDTPEVLGRYAQAIGAKSGLTFLTGRKADIDLLRRKLGVYDPDPVIDGDKSQHGALFIYGNEATGKWQAIPALLPTRRIVEGVRAVM